MVGGGEGAHGLRGLHRTVGEMVDARGSARHATSGSVGDLRGVHCVDFELAVERPAAVLGSFDQLPADEVRHVGRDGVALVGQEQAARRDADLLADLASGQRALTGKRCNDRLDEILLALEGRELRIGIWSRHVVLAFLVDDLLDAGFSPHFTLPFHDLTSLMRLRSSPASTSWARRLLTRTGNRVLTSSYIR